MLNYNDPRAIDVYTNFLKMVTLRYREAPSIGAWVIGNEFAFYDLWEDLTVLPGHRFFGFDEEYSIPAYHRFLEVRTHNFVRWHSCTLDGVIAQFQCF